MKVVVGASSFDDNGAGIGDLFASRGIELVKNPYKRRMSKDEIIQLLIDADGLLAGLEPLDEDVFNSCTALKAIARIGIGMDNVDLVAAKRHRIAVSNTPYGPTQAVAEMTVSALLSICHCIYPSNADIHNNIWKKRLGYSVSELTILIIGYGRIGRETARILRLLGAEVLVYDNVNTDESDFATIEEAIKNVDVISLHASGNEEILTPKLFDLMNDGVIVLNSARGGLINEKAVYDALKSGKLSFFWGDALWEEPYSGKLIECENAILTPHISTYTRKCRNSMERQAAENLLRDLGYEV